MDDARTLDRVVEELADAPGAPSHVVAIGASAGGLEPIEMLFGTIPGNTGAAFVLIQHLSPDFKSLMDQLLGRRTSMSIVRVHEPTTIERDKVYLIPPRKEMTIA
ncbi:MAG: chemotaxis protein CheB, partial [Pseudomonadota bacterium]